MRYSVKRNTILENLQNLKTHPTAEDIEQICKDIHVSAPTVYRNMSQLEEEGVVQRICTPFGKERYDGDVSWHNHVICPVCGKITDAPISKEMKELLEKENLDNGYSKANVVFYKNCEGCNSLKTKYNLKQKIKKTEDFKNG